MPVYQWVGKNRNNEVQKGELEAVSEESDAPADYADQSQEKTERPI